MIEERFRLACKKFELNRNFYELDLSKFVRPKDHMSLQLEMF